MVLERGAQSFGEALTYFPEMDDYNTGPEAYVEHVAAAKAALSIPVIASINGVTPGGWVRYAELLQQAGADAIELNVYAVETDPVRLGRERRGSDAAARQQGARRAHGAARGQGRAVLHRVREHRGAPRRRRRGRPRPVQPLPAARHRPRDDDGEARAPPLAATRRCGCRCAGSRSSAGRVPASLAATSGVQSTRRRGQAAARRGRRGDARLGAAAPGARRAARADRRAVGLADGARVRLGRAAEGQHEPGVVRRPARLRALPVRPRDRRLPARAGRGGSS